MVVGAGLVAVRRVRSECVCHLHVRRDCVQIPRVHVCARVTVLDRRGLPSAEIPVCRISSRGRPGLRVYHLVAVPGCGAPRGCPRRGCYGITRSFK